MWKKEKSQEICKMSSTEVVTLKSLNNFPGNKIRDRKDKKDGSEFFIRGLRSRGWQ